MSQWLSWCHADYAIADTRQFLDGRAEAFQKDGEYSFAIIERASGRFVGATGINQIEKAALRANLGYWLRTSATGEATRTQAAKLVARWAFESLALERIEIVAATGNVASQRVAERVGRHARSHRPQSPAGTRRATRRGRVLTHPRRYADLVAAAVPPATTYAERRKPLK